MEIGYHDDTKKLVDNSPFHLENSIERVTFSFLIETSHNPFSLTKLFQMALYSNQQPFETSDGCLFPIIID